MIVLAALAAGLLPFLWNWISAGRMGTGVPLAELQEAVSAMPMLAANRRGASVDRSIAMVAGLQPAVFPGWMAAGLSSLGVWINTPLQWLLWWIVYGLAVLLIAKILGATTTLQQFYTLTSFAFLPLMLTGLGPIPCLGTLAVLAALFWALAVYVAGVRSATRLSFGMSLLCTILPGATFFLLAVVAAIATAASVVGVFF